MVRKYVVNGVSYEIEYQSSLSTMFYTQRSVYHIRTKDEDYNHAKNVIASIMEEILGHRQQSIWSEELYKLKNKQEPCMENDLHVYYTFSFDEERGVYVYTFVRPYDD